MPTAVVHFARTEQDSERHACATGLAKRLTRDIQNVELAHGNRANATVVSGGDAGSDESPKRAANVVERRDSEKLRVLIELPQPLAHNANTKQIERALALLATPTNAKDTDGNTPWPLYDRVIRQLFIERNGGGKGKGGAGGKGGEGMKKPTTQWINTINALIFSKAALMVDATFRPPLRPTETEGSASQLRAADPSDLVDAAITTAAGEYDSVRVQSEWLREHVGALRLHIDSTGQPFGRFMKAVARLIEESVDAEDGEMGAQRSRAMAATVRALHSRVTEGSTLALLTKTGDIAAVHESVDSDDPWRVMCTRSSLMGRRGTLPIPKGAEGIEWTPMSDLRDDAVWAMSISALHRHAAAHVICGHPGRPTTRPDQSHPDQSHPDPPLELVFAGNPIVYKWPQVLRVLADIDATSTPREHPPTMLPTRENSTVWLLDNKRLIGQRPSFEVTVATDGRAWCKQLEAQLAQRWMGIPDLEDDAMSLGIRLVRVGGDPSEWATDNSLVVGPEVIHVSPTTGTQRRARMLVLCPRRGDPSYTQYVLTSPTLVDRLLVILAAAGDEGVTGGVTGGVPDEPEFEFSDLFDGVSLEGDHERATSPTLPEPAVVSIGALVVQRETRSSSMVYATKGEAHRGAHRGGHRGGHLGDRLAAISDHQATPHDEEEEALRRATAYYGRKTLPEGNLRDHALHPALDDKRFTCNAKGPSQKTVDKALAYVRNVHPGHIGKLIETHDIEDDETRRTTTVMGYCTRPSDRAIGRQLCCESLGDGLWTTSAKL